MFRRESESIIITRLSLPTSTLLVVIGCDGAPRSRSFPSLEAAMAYHLQLESALVAGGWHQYVRLLDARTGKVIRYIGCPEQQKASPNRQLQTPGL